MTQRKFLFPADQVPVPEYTADRIEGLDRVWLDVSGERVESWFIPSENENKKPSPVILFAHGNGELIDYWLDEFNQFIRYGISVMLVEYPGYGRSGGNPSQESVTETFVKAYDFLVERPDVDKNAIIFLGRSLGGGAVCALTEQRTPAALILMSTFTSARSFAKRYLAPGTLILDPFENLKIVAEYTGPVLIIHGKNDDLIPFSHGQKLYEAAQDGEMIIYDSGHNDCPPDLQTFISDILGFLKQKAVM